MELETVGRILAALEREGVRYIVFGAVAVNLLGLPRATEDLDIFIAPEPENVERLKKALFSVFEDPSIEEINVEDLLGDYPAVQYIPPVGDFHIDILTRLGEMFRFDELESLRVELNGQLVTVATPKTLYRMKKDTVRPKDWGDAAALRLRFKLEDN